MESTSKFKPLLTGVVSPRDRLGVRVGDTEKVAALDNPPSRKRVIVFVKPTRAHQHTNKVTPQNDPPRRTCCMLQGLIAYLSAIPSQPHQGSRPPGPATVARLQPLLRKPSTRLKSIMKISKVARSACLSQLQVGIRRLPFAAEGSATECIPRPSKSFILLNLKKSDHF